MTKIEDKIQACRIARAEVEAELIRVDRAIDRIRTKPRCSWCCAPSGQPCRTRRGDVRLYTHIHRMNDRTDKDEIRLRRLYRQLEQLRAALV
jgi:hypothetical protein